MLGRCPERSYHLCAVAAEGPPQCGMPIPQPGLLPGSVAEVRVGLPMAWLAEPAAGPAFSFRPCIGIQAGVAGQRVAQWQERKVCVCVCVWVLVRVCGPCVSFVRLFVWCLRACSCMYVCVCVCVCVSVSVYVYVCVRIYIYIHIYLHISISYQFTM